MVAQAGPVNYDMRTVERTERLCMSHARSPVISQQYKYIYELERKRIMDIFMEESVEEEFPGFPAHSPLATGARFSSRQQPPAGKQMFF